MLLLLSLLLDVCMCITTMLWRYQKWDGRKWITTIKYWKIIRCFSGKSTHMEQIKKHYYYRFQFNSMFHIYIVSFFPYSFSSFKTKKSFVFYFLNFFFYMYCYIFFLLRHNLYFKLYTVCSFPSFNRSYTVFLSFHC